MRTFAEWGDARIGDMEPDLLVHCRAAKTGSYMGTRAVGSLMSGLACFSVWSSAGIDAGGVPMPSPLDCREGIVTIRSKLGLENPAMNYRYRPWPGLRIHGHVRVTVLESIDSGHHTKACLAQ